MSSAGHRRHHHPPPPISTGTTNNTNVNNNATNAPLASSSSSTTNRRPASIGELADRAMNFHWDPRKEFKHCLKMAERARNEAREYHDSGDYENAFVCFARAASIALEMMPKHPNYMTALSEVQRQNLKLNGQEILDSMSRIKPILVDRFNEWRATHPDEPVVVVRAEGREREAGGGIESAMAEEAALWKEQREDMERQMRRHRQQDYSFSSSQPHGSQSTIVVMPDAAEERRRGEREEKRRIEQQGIARRQQEAEAEARQIRHTIAVNSTHLPGNPSFYPPPTAPPVTPVRNSHSHPQPEQPAFLFPGSSPADVHRTPTRATVRSHQTQPDFITTTSPPPQVQRSLFPTIMSPHQLKQGYWPSHSAALFSSMDRLTLSDTTNTVPSSNIYAPTTAAGGQPLPPPPWGWNAYGAQAESHKSAAAAAAAQVGQRLMEGSGRVRKSKYNEPPPPLFHPAENAAPPPSSSSSSSSMPYIPMPPPPPPLPPPPHSAPPASTSIAASGRIHPSSHTRSNSTRSSLHPTASPSKHPILKPVLLPRETLPRFLAIAKVNTSMNRETCGLLLGKIYIDGEESGTSSPPKSKAGGDGGERDRSEYVVTTLLIPKQHGTSDMCSMDEEELVMQFVDERSLITLGWIHTHPSQSCFMSSVDLHTHSGFQRMLPESVAVVCAPKSNPNFGIFRLTDPPGLSTILECKEKEMFHPHPDLPIYTDADKGHVHMRDAPLEIIDLR